MSAIDDLAGLLKKDRSAGSDNVATVTRVGGNTAYVQLTGSEINDTPVAMSIAAKPGDKVRVRISNGRGQITGNDTAPPGNHEEQIKKVVQTGTDLDKKLKQLEEKISHAKLASYVGMIIHSTTLETEDQVIARYGGSSWIRHEGYFLRGAASGVTPDNAAADGGEATHTLTVNEMPSHTHALYMEYGTMVTSYDYPPISNYNQLGPYGPYSSRVDNTGGGQAHNNMPPFKNVYIWERTT